LASTLELVLLYLVAAVLGVVVCRSLKLPPMLGYLVVGVLIGPNALALAKDTAGVKYLAEFGVVFLMFVIGLEFNLPKLRSMRTLVFGLGSSQVLLTIAGTLLGHFALSYSWLDHGPALAHVVAGCGGAGGRHSDELHGHRRQAHGRTAGTGKRTRQACDGHPAVPGPGRGAAAGADPCAQFQR